MKIYVMRHGQTELNKQGIINGDLDDALSAEGVEQAKATREQLPSTIAHIYSSTLARAMQTAIIVNEKLEVPLTFHNELKEVNFGKLNGTPFLPDIKERHRMLDYDWRPTGECYDDVRNRVLKVLADIHRASGDGEALLVTHGGIVRLLHKLEHDDVLDDIGNASVYTFDLNTILKNAK